MGIFSNLMNSIWRHAPEATPAPAPAAAAAAPATATATAVAAPAAATATDAGTAGTAQVKVIDVEGILDGLRAKSSDDLDWRHSIVDLLKLVGMDSSLAARKELAKELHYTGDTSDSATMNIWLHREVLTRITMNGGKVPESLLT